MSVNTMDEALGMTAGNTLVKQICNVAIMFVATSDEQAMNVKRQLAESMKDFPNARIQFSMMNAPQPNIPPM